MPTEEEKRDYQKAYYKKNKDRYKEIRIAKALKENLDRYQKYKYSNKITFRTN
jgi:hypothetical protein|tara:strand:- start:1045 stop:1203 length:159 start_codon:yes stop_codon:yes gene_type:complete